jgi:hypothetical protein
VLQIDAGHSRECLSSERTRVATVGTSLQILCCKRRVFAARPLIEGPGSYFWPKIWHEGSGARKFQPRGGTGRFVVTRRRISGLGSDLDAPLRLFALCNSSKCWWETGDNRTRRRAFEQNQQIISKSAGFGLQCLAAVQHLVLLVDIICLRRLLAQINSSLFVFSENLACIFEIDPTARPKVDMMHGCDLCNLLARVRASQTERTA